MKMWIGCLASYNNGVLFGEWVDVSTDAEENADQIARVLAASPVKGAEEYMISDYEAPGAIADAFGEYPTAQKLADGARLVDALESHWPDYADLDAVLGVMLDGRMGDIAGLADEADEWISDRYAGEGETLIDWCEEFLDNTGFFGELSGSNRDQIVQYFNYEAYARDLELGGDVSSVRVNGRVLVFWNR
jgi:antirestriction protein